MADSVQAGRLEDEPLPRLLLALAARGADGELHIDLGRARARVALRAGHPLRCTLEGKEEDTGGAAELLVASGALSAEDADRVRRTMAAKGCSEEAALLGLQLASPRALIGAMRALLSRRLVALARHERGAWRLDSDVAVPGGSDALRVDPLPVVREMVQAHWRPDRMLADLARHAGAHPAPGERFAALAERLGGGEAVARLAAALDGSRDLWRLLGGAHDREAIAALWVLDRAGALRWEAAPAEAEAAAETEEPAADGKDGEAGEAEIEIVIAGAGTRAAPRAEARSATDRAAPGGGASPGRGARAEALRREIDEKHGQLADLDHYALLGVARDAGAGAIKRAYLQAAKRFHPDALARLGLADLRARANAVFAEITRAHATLGDPERRRGYDAELAGESAGDAERIAQAEVLYRKGEALMRMGNFAGALDFVQAAVQLYDEDPAYQGALGWCLFKRTPPDLASARDHLERALALEAGDAVAHLRLGIVLKELGEEALARRATARARELDPKARA